MSAIHNLPPNENAIVRKYHTRIKVIVHGHLIEEALDLSDNVTNVHTGKNIKGTGQANITLAPVMNYLNYIGPNDYINVYFDRSDGMGWTRVFFGLIDRIEESYSVNEKGAPTTLYSLLCSDFSKVFDKSQYYTNTNIIGRDDVFINEIGHGAPDIALYTNGLQIHGSPPDIVSQLAIGLIGFSGQFGLPDSYASAAGNSTLVGENRELRMNLASALMTPEANAALPGGGLLGVASAASQKGELAAATASALRGTTGSIELATIAAEFGVDVDSLPVHLRNNPYAVHKYVANRHVMDAMQTLPGFASQKDAFGSRESAIVNIVTSGLPGSPRNMLSLVNLGTFVERRAIDGYIFGGGVPNTDNSVMSLIRQWTNEMVNELFFDLRPVSAKNSGMSVGTNWSTDPDEIGENKGGVRYVPAMIMREYPFSTVPKLDATEVTHSLGGANSKTASFGEMIFGAIFSDGPNVPGRHIIEIPNINVADAALRGEDVTKKEVAYKHLDVATIHSSEIIRSTFSRSDSDVINLIELTTEDGSGTSSQRYMLDMLPLITPIHIRRHGLRVKADSTRFARFELQPAKDEPSQTEEPESTEETNEEASTPPQPSRPVVLGELHPPMIIRPGQLTRRHPISPNPLSNIRWGYVRFEGRKVRVHHGIDIFARTGQEVYAIMGGTVVWVAPNGSGKSNNIYGNTIVIHHPGGGVHGEDVWSVYCHLGVPKHLGIARGNDLPPLGKLNPAYDENFPEKSSGMVVSEGDVVTTGQLIGYAGWTAGFVKTRKNESTYQDWYKTSGIRQGSNPHMGQTHVHFEILRKRGGMGEDNENGPYPAMQSSTEHRIDLLPGKNGKDGVPVGYPPYAGTTQAKLDNLSSTDPVKFFKDKANVNLLTAVDQRGSSTAEPDDEDDTTGYEDDDDDNPRTPPTRTNSTPRNRAPAQNSGTGSNLDGSRVQKSVARWALLQDHWYQHNPEYLSGTIDMRGAPEIRVGYRLDIVDRNLSFYVESVSHKWQYPGAMVTSINVTRGQPNNPYPSYTLPRTKGLSAGPAQRDIGSRLGMFFLAPDPLSIRRSLVIRNQNATLPKFSADKNTLDTHASLSRNSGENFMVAVTETAPVRAPVEPVLDAPAGDPEVNMSIDHSVDPATVMSMDPTLDVNSSQPPDESTLSSQPTALFNVNPSGVRNV